MFVSSSIYCSVSGLWSVYATSRYTEGPFGVLTAEFVGLVAANLDVDCATDSVSTPIDGISRQAGAVHYLG